MRDECDFSGGKRGAVIQSRGKTQIILMLDDDIVEHFRARADAAGTGYQDLINDILREATAPKAVPGSDDAPLTVSALRRVLREELHSS